MREGEIVLSNFGNQNVKDEIRRLLERGQLDAALQMCEQIDDQDPDFYYLQARIFVEKGWTQRARDYMKIATQMDPDNFEYRQLWQRLDNPGQTYKAQSNQQGYTRGCSCCDIAACACCSDCCCESMGGDLIPCC